MEKKEVFAIVLKGLLQQLEPESTRQHSARDDDDRLKRLVREVMDEKNQTTAQTELLHRVIDLMEKQEDNKSRDKPKHQQDVADVTQTFQNLMKQTDLDKKPAATGGNSSQKQKLLELLDKKCNNQEAAAEKNLSKNVTKNRFAPGPFHDDGEFNKPQSLKEPLPDTGATKKVLNNGATNTTTKPARGRGNKRGAAQPHAPGPQPLLQTGPYPNPGPYPGQAPGYPGPDQHQQGGFHPRGRGNFPPRGRGNHTHRGDGSHYQRLDDSQYQNQGPYNYQNDGQHNYQEPGPQQYQNYGPGNYQNSRYPQNQGGDYHNVPFSYQNQEGGYQGRGRGNGYHQDGSSQRGGRGGFHNSGPDNFQNQGDGGYRGRDRGNYHKRGTGETQNLGRGGYPNAGPGNFSEQAPHVPQQKDMRSRPAHARGEGQARSRSAHRGGKAQLSAAQSQDSLLGTPYVSQGAYPKNVPSGGQAQAKPKKNRKPKPRRDEEPEQEGEESRNLNASQHALENILGDGHDSVDSDSSIVSAFVSGVFAKKRNKNYAKNKKTNALKKAGSVNSLIADKANPGNSKDSSSEVLQDVVGDPVKTTGSVAGSTDSPVVSDAPLQLFLGSGFNEKVAKTMHNTSEIRDVMLVAKAGGEIISCAPKTLGELRAFKEKYPQAEVIVVRSQDE